MSARRGSRSRRRPTTIYQIEGTRYSAIGIDGYAEGKSAQLADNLGEESSEDGPEGKDEEFTPAGTKVKKPESARKATWTPAALAKSSRPKRSPWSQTRSLRSAEGDSMVKERVTAEVSGAEGDGINDNREAVIDSLFGMLEGLTAAMSSSINVDAIQVGKRSLENVLKKWHDRFKTDDKKAMKEILNLACGGTGQCVPESEPLDQLDMGGLVGHVVEELEKANGKYPLVSRGKGMRKFQLNFEEFWKAFVTECYESEILFTSEVINNLIDWLTTLSSSNLRPIRHTSTVAVLALSNSLVRTAANISEKLSIATRQLNAEINSPVSTPGGKKSTNVQKVSLLKGNKVQNETRLQQVLQLVNLIFTGVVVHRYRDIMPEIRVAAMQCLGHWITILPDQFLKDNFLKYLGWLLSDKSALVRLEVIEILCELYENDAFTERLALFTSRFLARYLELCSDVDDNVVEQCIHLLIAVDKHNLISSDIELQSVEKLVFDAEHEAIRKVAAEFVCLQYDAFGVAVLKTKNATLKKEQLITQAIALVEFVEEYIRNYSVPENAVETLVDAFWGLEDCSKLKLLAIPLKECMTYQIYAVVLQDWRLMTDLLLVDKSTPDLSNDQQAILLRILVASVKKLVVDVNRSASKKAFEQLQEEITVAYCKDIPSLFNLYQADSDKLVLLLELIPMLALKSEVIGHHSSHMKELLEKLKHAFLLHADQELLISLTLSIIHFLQTEHASLKREAEVIAHELIRVVMDSIDRFLEADVKLFDEVTNWTNGTPTTRSKNLKGKRKKSYKSKEVSDVEYGLRIALARFSCLVKYLNIREYLFSDASFQKLGKDDSINALNLRPGRVDTFIIAVGDLVHRRTKSTMGLDEGFRHVDTIKHGLAIIYFDMLWTTVPVFKATDVAKNCSSSYAVHESFEANVDPLIEVQIQQICRLRSTLEEALVSVLEMHLSSTNEAADEEHKEDGKACELQVMASLEKIELEDDNVKAYVREAQRFAFLTFCDARCLFVEKFQDATAPYDVLEWPLPKRLIHLTQMYFESEMDDAEEDEPKFEDEEVENVSEITEEKSSALRMWQEKQRRKAEMLVALGRVALCNPSKKHQAAAVLQYLTSSGKPSVEVVKAFGKKVKIDAPVRYLEIQMTALRRMYASILVWKQDIEAGQASEDFNEDTSTEQKEMKEKVRRSEQELRELAKRFSQSLGIGKIAASLRAPFLRFLCEGVRYAVSQLVHFEFLEIMRVYLPRLDSSGLAQLRDYFLEQLKTICDIPDDAEGLDSRWRSLFDFQALVTTAGANGGKGGSTNTMLSPPLSNKRQFLKPTSVQTISIAEEQEDEMGNCGDDVGAITEKVCFDNISVDKSDQHDRISRKRSSNNEPAVMADNKLDDTDTLPLRKRTRRSRNANKVTSGD
ncbi:hypothetical protein CCR75_003870 [Bremia lactucae]|uniref:SCD domain-containing protein n=1 Tax=Bremia lactucae TaxID=4779 RepID=A0A976IHU5_BRELC|nr:hypothetical protein CCR75_003870 [Bremia lactucae]